GFIGSRYGVPFAEPFTLTSLRMLIVVSMLLTVSVLSRAPWPRDWKSIAHIAVAGLLVHAAYLSGVMYAIYLQLPLGFIALVAGLQPLLTALLSYLTLNERLRGTQWLGMLLGFLGVLIAIASKFVLSEVRVGSLLAAGIALLGITIGTLYQKRFCQNMDLRTGGVIQFTATGVLLFLLALLFETRTVVWVPQFVFAILWLAVVLSIGAISLLYVMIRNGATSKVASLFFLTPSVTAVMAYFLFHESLSWFAIGGLVISACGVALVTRK
ncbi:MAG: DMT family transporter, partial [Pseudomonadota bacterium]